MVCVSVICLDMSVTLAFAGRLGTVGRLLCVPICQLHWLLLVDLDSGVSVVCPHMSVTLAFAGRLGQWGVCVVCPHMSVTLAFAGRLGQWGACVMCQCTGSGYSTWAVVCVCVCFQSNYPSFNDLVDHRGCVIQG